MEGLTFRQLRGMVPYHRLDDISGIRDDSGGHTMLALVLSDQCPYGVTVLAPDGSEIRIGGSVLSQLDDAKEVINRFNDKSVMEGSRTPVDRFPRAAIREALLNAIVHRDYSVPDDIVVTVGADELTVVSPGSAHKGLDGIRNPLLVDVMEMYRIKGYRRDGISAMRKCYSRFGYEPKAVSGLRSFKVTLPAVKVVRGYYMAKVSRITEYMDGRGGVTFEEIEHLLKLSKSYTFRIINHMEADGLIFSMYGGTVRRFYLCNKGRRGSG